MTTTKFGTDPLKQDSAFYTYTSGTEVIWEDVACSHYVVRAGEMRIHATKNNGETIEVIRYTDRLEEFGIKTDADLAEWSAKDEEIFSWQNNSWFEVYTESDPDFFSEPFHTLDEAIEYAVSLDKEEN